MSAVEMAAVLAVAVVLASVLSVEIGISVALLELGLGVMAGNLFHLDVNADWLVFIAGFASIVLTFLAGAEVDPDDFRERLGASLPRSVTKQALISSLPTRVSLRPVSTRTAHRAGAVGDLHPTQRLLPALPGRLGGADRDAPAARPDGLNAGIIDRTQFSLLVTVVVLSAIVPTAIAQRRFSPDVEAERSARGGEAVAAPVLPAGEPA